MTISDNPCLKMPDYKLRFVIDLFTERNNWERLFLLFSEIDFLEGEIFQIGIDDLLVRCNRIIGLAPISHKLHKTIDEIQQILLLESHNLRVMNSSYSSSFILQQVHNRAKELGLDNIIKDTSARLQQRRIPYLILKWSTRIASNQLMQTIIPDTSIQTLSITSNGKFLVAGGQISHSRLQVWNLISGQLEWAGGDVGKVLTLPGELQVTCVTSDGKLSLWDIESGQLLWSTLTNDRYTTDILLITADHKIATASSNGDIKIWSIDNGQLLHSLSAITDTHRLGLIPNKPWLVMISATNKSLMVWNYEIGQQEFSLKGHDMGIIDFAASKDGMHIATISYDNSVVVWNLVTRVQESVFVWHYDDEMDMDFEGISRYTVKVVLNQEYLVFTSDVFGTVEIWDYKRKIKVNTIAEPEGLVHNMRVSSDNQYLVISYGTHIKIFEIATGLLVGESSEHESQIEDIAINFDESLLITASRNYIKVFGFQQLLNNKPISTKHRFSVEKIIVIHSKGAENIVSASATEIKIHNLETGKEQIHFNYSRDSVGNLMVSKDREHVMLTTISGFKIFHISPPAKGMELNTEGPLSISKVSDNHLAAVIRGRQKDLIQVYDLLTGKLVDKLTDNNGGLDKVWLSPDSRWIVTEAHDWFLELLELPSGKMTKEIRFYANSPSILIASKKRRLITFEGFLDTTLKIWDFDFDKTSPLIEVESRPPFRDRVTLTRDESVILSLEDNQLIARDVSTYQVINSFEIPESFGARIKPLNNSQVIIAGSAKSEGWTGEIDIWNIDSGQKDKTLGQHPNLFNVQTALDGQMVLSWSSGELKIWNSKTGDSRSIPVSVSSSWIITSDGQRMVDFTGNSIHIWNMEQQTQEVVLSEHTCEIIEIHIAADGNTLISISNNEIILWDLVTYQLLDKFNIASNCTVRDAVISQDGNFAVLLRHGKSIKMWDRTTEGANFEFTAHAGYCDVHGFTQDNRIVLSRTNGTVASIDLESHEETTVGNDSYLYSLLAQSPYFGEDYGNQSSTSKLAVYTQKNRTINVRHTEQETDCATAMFDVEIGCTYMSNQSGLIIVGDRSGHLYCLECVNA